MDVLPVEPQAFVCFSPGPGIGVEEPATEELAPGCLRQRLLGFINTVLSMPQQGVGCPTSTAVNSYA